MKDIEDKLDKSGFVKMDDKTVFVKRIHEQILLEFDTSDSFFMLIRRPENTKAFHKIIVPNKIKDWPHFKEVYEALTGEKL